MSFFQIASLNPFLEKNDYQGLMNAISDIPESERNYESLMPYCRKYLLYHVFPNSFSGGAELDIHDDHVRIPGWELSVAPVIKTLTGNTIIIDLFLSCPLWDGRLYECCSGVGGDITQAMGTAMGSFFFSFLDGFGRVTDRRDPIMAETSFAGKKHRFEVYLSNITGMGTSPLDEEVDVTVYWKSLCDGILKRLGNQPFCLVKIFGSKFNGEVTGECRIGDIPSKELGEAVADLVRPWETEQFYSHKQFIMIRQTEETLLPYPYSGEEGRRKFRDAVVTAARLFHESDTEERYESYPERLAEAIGDATLAQECRSFLPELCARNAYSQVSYEETIGISIGSAPVITCYQTQLADYWSMWNVLLTAFQDGTFGQEANAIYREYISVSATYSVLQQIQEKNPTLSGSQLSTLLFRMDDGFCLR